MMLKTFNPSRGIKTNLKKYIPTFQQIFNFSTLLKILILFILLILLSLLFQWNRIPETNSIQRTNWIEYTLSEAASKIAQHNTLIVCTVTEPYLPVLNNWLISISKQNHEDKVLVIAEDYPTLIKINSKWPGHAVFLSPTFNKSNQGDAYRFGSEGFKNLTDKRAQYLLQILELGYNVMFNDVDMVWLADPFPYMKGEHDVYFTDDRLDVKPLNHSHDLPPRGKEGTPYMCACMIYMRPTSGSKKLMKKWIEEIRGNETWYTWHKDDDQYAFNRALNKIKIAGQAKLYVLPQTGFPSGGLYYRNRKWVKKNEGRLVIIHNNHVIGLDKKIQRFREYGLWFVEDFFSHRI